MPKGISYQNKDVLMKVLSQNYKDKSFKALGLDLPKIKKVLPTNLPNVTATELRVDGMFLLEDDRIAIVDYESTTGIKNFFKYIDYVSGTLKLYYNLEKKIYNIVVLIIYTGDVKKTEHTFTLDCMQFNVKQIYLSRLDTNAIYDELKQKIEAGESLTDEELMKLIVLPLTEPTKERKQQLIEKTVDLAKNIADEEQQIFTIAGILVASDKFIDEDYSNMIKEWISMTKVSRIFEREKIEAMERTAKEINTSVVLELLKDGVDILNIMKYTKLTKEEVFQIQNELEVSAAN